MKKQPLRLPIERTCKMCGVLYESTAARSAYCSGTCRLAYQAAYARKYRDTHRDKITAYNKEYWRQTHEYYENHKIPQQESDY